jgi:cell division protein FtsB
MSKRALEIVLVLNLVLVLGLFFYVRNTAVNGMDRAKRIVKLQNSLADLASENKNLQQRLNKLQSAKGDKK